MAKTSTARRSVKRKAAPPSARVLQLAKGARRPLRVNNVTVGAGTPFDVATDDVGGFHYQLLKLVDGTENGSERIGGSAAFGLHVELKKAIDLEFARSAVATHTVTPVSTGAAAQIAAANPARRNMTVHNASAVVMWIRLGSAVTLANANFPIDPGETYEMPSPAYTGVVTAIWEAADAGDCRVVEF